MTATDPRRALYRAILAHLGAALAELVRAVDLALAWLDGPDDTGDCDDWRARSEREEDREW